MVIEVRNCIMGTFDAFSTWQGVLEAPCELQVVTFEWLESSVVWAITFVTFATLFGTSV